MALKLPPEPDDEQVVLARQALHARRIQFDHPLTGVRMALESPLPKDIQEALDLLRNR